MKWLVCDSEYNALDLNDVTKVWCICAHDIESKEDYSWGPEEIPAALEFLYKSDRLIGHNLIQADFAVWRKLHGWSYTMCVVDTLLLSRLSNPDRKKPIDYTGRDGPHSLAVWGHRLQGEQKVEHEDWSKFSLKMLERCRSDVRINLAIYDALYREMNQ